MENIPYTVVRTSRRKSVGITVAPDNTVIVRAPYALREAKIAELVAEKKAWIQRRLEFNRVHVKQRSPRMFADGEEFLFLGKAYRIERTFGSKGIALSGDRLWIGVRFLPDDEEETERIAARLTRWCRSHARGVICERVAHYAALLGVEPSTIRLKTLTSRWGSCSSKGNLNFNWKLVFAPVPVIEYVVVHELCHFAHPNHSARFWALVESILPDFKERRKWLKMNGSNLTID